MTYAVRFTLSGFTHEPTDNYEKACFDAICFSRWSKTCDVIEVETGEIKKHIPAYNEAFEKAEYEKLHQTT